MRVMGSVVKALLAVALVVPLVAYVAATLASTGDVAPEQQGTVHLQDMDPVTEAPRPTSDPSSTVAPGLTGSRSHDDDTPEPPPAPVEARVVIPAPVGDDDDDDDDDERDDERDDDRHDTDDGGTDG